MNKQFLRILTLLVILNGFVFTNMAIAESTVGLGQVAKNLLEPVDVISAFVNTACFAIGGAFLFTSLIKYFEHKRSPMMVPISTVVFLVIAGIILILLPFLSLLTGNGS